jgi:5-methyltetrahydrofolate--homocysteine methyltransferase
MQFTGKEPMTDVLQEISKGILDGDVQLTASKVEEALRQGIDAETILNQAMVASMAEVGKLFEAGEFFVPEMMVSARAMQNGMNILRPHLVKAKVKSAGKVAAGTVQGDLHDIGKNLVCLMLEGAGFEIIDLGVNVSPQQFVEAVQTGEADLVAMSALLTTTMTSMQSTIAALKEADLRDKVKVMVGGAPVTEQYASQIGADGYAPDASRAVTLAKGLMDITRVGPENPT